MAYSTLLASAVQEGVDNSLRQIPQHDARRKRARALSLPFLQDADSCSHDARLSDSAICRDSTSNVLQLCQSRHVSNRVSPLLARSNPPADTSYLSPRLSSSGQRTTVLDSNRSILPSNQGLSSLKRSCRLSRTGSRMNV